LGREPAHEELEPARQIEVSLANALDRAVEGAAVAVVELAEREQALEVVACAIEVQRREQSRRAPVSVDEKDPKKRPYADLRWFGSRTSRRRRCQRLQVVETLEEEEVGDLLDHLQRIRDSAQNASQIRSIWFLISPVIMSGLLMATSE
jgi:hypothetical protein